MSDLDAFTDAELERQAELHASAFESIARRIDACFDATARANGAPAPWSARYAVLAAARDEQHELMRAVHLELARRFMERATIFPAPQP